MRYSALAGEQRELSMHTDGSIFSFNILLNDPTDFDGGGTYFEPTAMTAREARGTAIGHSGQVRHSGLAITRGERYLLVGFIGCATYPYSLSDAAAAARDAFCKFGDGAWRRDDDLVVPRPLEQQGASRVPCRVHHGESSIAAGASESSPAPHAPREAQRAADITYVAVD